MPEPHPVGRIRRGGTLASCPVPLDPAFLLLLMSGAGVLAFLMVFLTVAACELADTPLAYGHAQFDAAISLL